LLRPIRESNRLWLNGVENRRRIALGIGVAALGLSFAIGLSASLKNSREASKLAEVLALSSNLVDASSKLTSNNRELALLLAVEAIQVNDSMQTRGNLLAQVQKADRIRQLDRIDNRDITSSIAVPGTEFIAVITSDNNLMMWNYKKGGVFVA